MQANMHLSEALGQSDEIVLGCSDGGVLQKTHQPQTPICLVSLKRPLHGVLRST